MIPKTCSLSGRNGLHSVLSDFRLPNPTKMNYQAVRKSIFLFAFFLPFLGLSQTQVSGVIPTNSTWTKAGSPYNISGNAQVSAGDVLTIEPGTKIVFTGDFYLRTLGNITAVGNATDSIYFETNSPTTKIGRFLL